MIGTTKYSSALFMLHVFLLCTWSCTGEITSLRRKSIKFVDFLAKHQQNNHSINDYGDNRLYEVVSSRTVGNDDSAETYEQEQQQQQFQQQYASKYNGAAAAGHQQQLHQLNPLLKQAGTVSICILFILLIWRSLAAYELADQFNSGTLRILAVSPTVLILCCNLMGFVINVMRPYNFKNFLKFILALNITREFVELLYNVVMLVANTSTSGISRDVYFGRFFMNVWWLSLCGTFSKSRWVLQIVSPAQDNIRMNAYQQQSQPQQHNYQTASDRNQKYN